MKLPCELIQEPYLARVRRYVTQELSKKGWSQNQIAKTLGISQALVSNYLRKEKRKRIPGEATDKINIKAKEVASIVATFFLRKIEDAKIQAVEKICEECKFMRAEGPFCTLHINAEPIFSLKSPCTSCRSSKELVKLMSSERYHITSELQRAVDLLEKIVGVSRVIPEIGMQMVYGGKRMKTYLDIAGFPGRISKYKERLIRVSRPEFGASKHTAELLLLVNRVNKDFRAFGVLSNTRWIKEAIEKQGITTIETQFDTIGRLEDLETKEIRQSETPIALVSHPRIGIEGVIYLGASNPIEISKIVRELILKT